jgi:hypothetical protein
MLVPCRVSKEVADEFVNRLHRHHDPDLGARFVVGAWCTTQGRLVGVGVVGRPRARGIDQHRVVEVTRCCTDGTKNACSFVYARAAQIAQAFGFRAIMTYTLADEGGRSLRALGWWPEALRIDGSKSTWANRAGREDALRVANIRWACLLNEECYLAEMPSNEKPQLALW